MKRKLIGQGSGALTLSVPKSWIENNKLKKGQEIEVKEIDNQLVVSSSNYEYFKSVEINVENMDRNVFIKTIESYYENGATEINLKFNKKTLLDPWKNIHRKIKDETNFVVNRLIGFEIINFTENKITLKDVSKTNVSEFDNIFRRIMFLILEFSRELKESIELNNKMENGEEFHDQISKFISFCLRLLSLDKNRSDVEKINLHTLLHGLDNITDDFRYLSRDYNNNHKVKDKNLIFELMLYLEDFFKFYNKYDINIANNLDIMRKKLKEKILKCEDILTIRFGSLLEELQGLIIVVISLHEVTNFN